MKRTLSILGLAAIGWLYAVAGAGAQPLSAQANGPAQEVLSALSELKALYARNLTEVQRLEDAKRVIIPRIDFNELARRVLGKGTKEFGHNYRMYESRAAEFVAILEQFVASAFVPKAEKVRDVEKWELLQETVYHGTADVGVMLFLVDGKTGEWTTANIYFKMHQVNGVWRVYDFVHPFGGFVSSYRSQVDRILRKDGFEELLEKFENK